ncbi:bifunctional polynucleotide phosphatase kinase [Nannochloropsis oceanica]
MALSTAKPSSSSFLKGVHVYFLGLSNTFAQPATKALQANSGRVIPPKISSFFQKAAAVSVSKHFPPDMTHVLCGDKYQDASPASILMDLGVEGPLPSSIKVVHHSWLSECLKMKRCVDTTPFEIDMQAKPFAPAEDGGGGGGGGGGDRGGDDVSGKHPARGDQPQGASTNGKRPRLDISSNIFADDSLPPAPPLLQGHTPKRLSYSFIPPNQEWLMYDVGLLHLRVHPAAAAAAAAAASINYNTESIPESCTSPVSSPPPAPPSFPIRIAAFDLDSTLIKTRSQKSFAASPTDWQWFHPSVPPTLKALHQEGYKVVIISNQRGIESKNTDLSSLLQRLASVVSALKIPEIEGYFATHHSVFYKPAPGSWYLLEEKYRGGGGGRKEGGGEEGIDTANSFFVGDAAGRPKQGKMRGRDHSDSDLKLAVNVGGIGFKTPEEFFLGSRLSCDKGEVLKAAIERERRSAVEEYVVVRRKGSGCRTSNGSTGLPSSTLSTGEHGQSVTPPSVPPSVPPSPPTRQEAVLLLGPPACGKSTYCHIHLPHHTRINQDTLKSLNKCQRAALEALEKGESIVIDATNATSKLRKQWVHLLRSCPLPSLPSSSSSSTFLLLKVVEFLPPKVATIHLNFFRGINLDATAVEGREGGRAEGADFLRCVPERVIHSFFKLIEPVKEDGGKEEGFEEHVQVKELVLKPFRNRREAHLFGCYLPSIR